MNIMAGNYPKQLSRSPASERKQEKRHKKNVSVNMLMFGLDFKGLSRQCDVTVVRRLGCIYYPSL